MICIYGNYIPLDYKSVMDIKYFPVSMDITRKDVRFNLNLVKICKILEIIRTVSVLGFLILAKRFPQYINFPHVRKKEINILIAQ